jgi:hypothetical protein
MGAIVSLGRIGIKILDEIARGLGAWRASAPDGAPRVALLTAWLSIPFATADGSAAPGAVFPDVGGVARLSDARAWLLGLSVPAFAAANDVAAAKPGARGVLVLRVQFDEALRLAAAGE